MCVTLEGLLLLFFPLFPHPLHQPCSSSTVYLTQSWCRCWALQVQWRCLAWSCWRDSLWPAAEAPLVLNVWIKYADCIANMRNIYLAETKLFLAGTWALWGISCCLKCLPVVEESRAWRLSLETRSSSAACAVLLPATGCVKHKAECEFRTFNTSSEQRYKYKPRELGIYLDVPGLLSCIDEYLKVKLPELCRSSWKGAWGASQSLLLGVKGPALFFPPSHLLHSY